MHAYVFHVTSDARTARWLQVQLGRILGRCGESRHVLVQLHRCDEACRRQAESDWRGAENAIMVHRASCPRRLITATIATQSIHRDDRTAGGRTEMCQICRRARR